MEYMCSCIYKQTAATSMLSQLFDGAQVNLD